MSVTVLSPEQSAKEAPHPEEPEQPAKSDTAVNLSAVSGDDRLTTAAQQSCTQDGFAIPSTSAPSGNSSRASSIRQKFPSQLPPPHRHSNHRRANSESCISPTTFTPSSSSTPSSYNLRRGRKRPYRFQSVHPRYYNNNGSGQPHGGGKHKRARKKHDGGSFDASSHHHLNLNGGVGSRKFVAQSSGGRGGGGSSSGARRRHVKKPNAPNNTSSFLIDDLQKREAADNSSDGTSTTAAATRHRPRSYSSLAMVSPLEVDDDLDGSLEAEEDSEFAAEFDCASLERIEGLTRDQVNQEMLNVERMNRRLYDCVDNLKTENSKLKHLLEEKGISPPARDNISTATNKMHAEELLDHLTKSRSSSTEGSGGTTTEEQSEEIKQSNA